MKMPGLINLMTVGVDVYRNKSSGGAAANTNVAGIVGSLNESFSKYYYEFNPE